MPDTVTARDLRDIPLDQIRVGLSQVRTSDVYKDIDELADSIAKVGLLEPIIVRESGTDEYEVLAGQRRLIAHLRLRDSGRLPKGTITALVQAGPVDELDAKVLSLTENLVRRDLPEKDAIDACTELYLRYNSIKLVSQQTGLPERKVREYVKFPQLKDELKKMVRDEGVPLKVALQAQRAATDNEDHVDPERAVRFAREMLHMSNPQKERLVEAAQEKPAADAEQLIEEARKPPAVRTLRITLLERVHSSLEKYAGEAGTQPDDAAATLLEEVLSSKGYMAEDEL